MSKLDRTWRRPGALRKGAAETTHKKRTTRKNTGGGLGAPPAGHCLRLFDLYTLSTPSFRIVRVSFITNRVRAREEGLDCRGRQFFFPPNALATSKSM
ncbi:Protein CBG27135 [Caenorhabditis briggsae]|uniref:Protein CBG27135 n=1 Tax=Caenorhabditis briggsae TaxID=6238 RepID=B6IL45_CAEBR|nr:Protein CBG27135 [Caenorhabditis briggsae]CAS00598.1 Protein CBG27135 [Caenorhabditis briggsae]